MIIDIEQKFADGMPNPEWLNMRAGSVTASRLADVITKLKRNSKSGAKGEPTAAWYGYIKEIACERLTGLTAEHFVTPYMERGTEDEERAIAAYQQHYEIDMLPGGMAFHPSIKFFSASADLRSRDGKGGAEIKNLKAENHLEIIHEGVIPDKFLPQMIGEIDCYEWEWNDFVSYNKDFPKPYRLFVRRLWCDDTVMQTIAAVNEEVRLILGAVEDMLCTIKTKEPAMCREADAVMIGMEAK